MAVVRGIAERGGTTEGYYREGYYRGVLQRGTTEGVLQRVGEAPKGHSTGDSGGDDV